MILYRNKNDIINWLDHHDIQSYEVIPDEHYGHVVNVHGDVNLVSMIDCILVKFNIVEGSFNCSSNQLTTLEGCPHTVKEYFDCSYNKLTSLKHGPVYVMDTYKCVFNKLTSLEGSPEYFDGDFFCNNNKLKSLEHAPKVITGDFNAGGNDLNNLLFCPKVHGDTYLLMNSKLGNFQNEYESSVIYQEHLNQKIKFEKEQLEQKLSACDSVSNKQKTKI